VLMLLAIQRVMAVQDVGGLTQRQPKIGPVERNVSEADRGTTGFLLRTQPVGVGLNPGQRHPCLHPSQRVDEVDLHIDGRSQLGLDGSQLSQFENLARFGAGGPHRAVGVYRSVGHEGDCSVPPD
jgi:hypothetical protein